MRAIRERPGIRLGATIPFIYFQGRGKLWWEMTLSMERSVLPFTNSDGGTHSDMLRLWMGRKQFISMDGSDNRIYLNVWMEAKILFIYFYGRGIEILCQEQGSRYIAATLEFVLHLFLREETHFFNYPTRFMMARNINLKSEVSVVRNI